jgi:uncharacterized protein
MTTWTNKLVGSLFSGNRMESRAKKTARSTVPQEEEEQEFAFLSDYPKVLELIAAHADQLSDEALVKVLRQLEFWSKQQNKEEDGDLSEAHRLWMMEQAESLLFPFTNCDVLENFQCPTKRFGKTEIQMPIVTCGGMRLQYSWMPDSLGPLVSPHTRTVLNSPSQENLKACILKSIQHGLCHFETARMYGTSELQFATALGTLIDDKTILREDFILQTKIVPKATRAEFEKVWNESWAHWQDTIGYIDLFALHVVSSTKSCDWLLQPDSECMQFVYELQREGKIKHIGFSTHGTSQNVMRLINSQKFAYVNLHAHFFGDYHAEGTMNSSSSSNTSHGNHAAVQRALELDMGVFQISPLDKGGKVYQPSSTVAKLLGPSKLSPISFVCLHAWETLGFHTTSIGISRPADLDDALYAAYLYSRRCRGSNDDDFQASSSLQMAEQALTSRLHEALGTEWMNQGMMNLPDCEQPITQGVAIGHILWLHNLCQAFGMYDFCRERYANLESQTWNDKLSFQQNLLKFNDGNMGRGYTPHVDYEAALKDHYNAPLVIQKLKEAHEWLCKKSTPAITESQRLERGWDRAYNLTCWEDYPGAAPTATGVLLQIVTLNQFGCSGGPNKGVDFSLYAKKIRECILAMKMMMLVQDSSSSPPRPSSAVEPSQ